MATKGKQIDPVTTVDDAMMTKAQFVMRLKKEGIHVAHYATGTAEEDAVGTFKDAYMPHENFMELGKPDTITVTIVPGDVLND